MTRIAIILLTLLLAGSAPPVELPDEAPCTVCTRRGATHGAEKVVAHRVHEDELYTFCSDPCAEAFDQMPGGYAEPVLPRPAPQATLRTLENEPLEFAPEGTRAVLVDFWATWCQPCLVAMPELEALYEEHADNGLRVLGISIDEDSKALRRFLAKRAPNYPVAHDDDEEAPAWWAWQVPAIPALFLVDGEGQVVAQWAGEADMDEIRQEVDALLQLPR